jgi:putative CocE/NonD family hydrolase
VGENRERTVIEHVVDRVVGRILGLTRPTSDYTIARRLSIPMRDGVELAADHYAPERPRGTVLVRGPYDRGGVGALLQARLFAARGYHVVVQSSRGTYGSGGEFVPFVHEADDGADTVAWLRRQPWFEGRFATMGASYLGFTQWALLLDPPPELTAAIVLVGPHDLGRVMWGSGAFRLEDSLGWAELVGHQERFGPVQAVVRAATADRRLKEGLHGLPLVEAGEQVLGGVSPWYREWASHEDPTDPYWDRMRAGAALDRVQVPVLLISGWQDLFLAQTLDQYARLRGRGVEVAFTAGPWKHVDLVGKGAPVVLREALDWLGSHLAGGPLRRHGGAVRVRLSGDGGWRDLADWPPAAQSHVLHLHPGGGLAGTPPPDDTPPSTFTYDPADPTPTVGGPLLAPTGGYRNDTALGRRKDVLVFTGPALPEPLEVIGVPVAELAHRSDNPHADLFVRLSEVDRRGHSRNVGEGFVRLPDDHADDTVRVDLDAVAHRFAAGSRLRVIVAGGSHPRFARNLGTGEPAATGVRLGVSRREVFHGASRITLPVVRCS